MPKPADMLVVTPHPDDAEFGVAGTVARLTKEGKEVVYVVCTNGDKGTDDINFDPQELARIREKEQLEAAKVLGVREVVFLRHPDQTLEDTPEFRKKLVRLIRMYQPYTVVTGDPNRRYLWHRDHRVSSRVTLDAVFPYARDIHSYPDLARDGLKPHKVREVLLWASEDPNYCLDITDTFDLKIAALRCHKSQISDSFSDELEQELRQRARDMAEGESYKLAEAFHREEILW